MRGNQEMPYLRDYIPLIDRDEDHVVQVGIGRWTRGALAGAEEVGLGECSDLRDRLKVKMNTCRGNGRHRILDSERELRGEVNQRLQHRLLSESARGSPGTRGKHRAVAETVLWCVVVAVAVLDEGEGVGQQTAEMMVWAHLIWTFTHSSVG